MKLLFSGWLIGLLVLLDHPSLLVGWLALGPIALVACLLHSLLRR